jgi:hypothetical protein
MRDDALGLDISCDMEMELDCFCPVINEATGTEWSCVLSSPSGPHRKSLSRSSFGWLWTWRVVSVTSLVLPPRTRRKINISAPAFAAHSPDGAAERHWSNGKTTLPSYLTHVDWSIEPIQESARAIVGVESKLRPAWLYHWPGAQRF